MPRQVPVHKRLHLVEVPVRVAGPAPKAGPGGLKAEISGSRAGNRGQEKTGGSPFDKAVPTT